VADKVYETWRKRQRRDYL